MNVSNNVRRRDKNTIMKHLFLSKNSNISPSKLLDGVKLYRLQSLIMNYNSDIRDLDYAYIRVNILDSSSKHIKYIQLKDCELDSARIGALFKEVSLLNLQILDLTGNTEIMESGWATIRRGVLIPSSASIKDLILKDCEIDTSQLISLFQGVRLTNLRKLNLEKSSGIDESAWAVLRSFVLLPSSNTLEYLNLADCMLTSVRVQAMLHGTCMNNIKEINLKGNFAILEHGWSAIKGSIMIPSANKIIRIHLGDCEVNSSRIQALFEGVYLKNLEYLNMQRNSGMEELGWYVLREWVFKYSPIKELILDNCKINDYNLQVLLYHIKFTKLETFELSRNYDINEHGIKMLRESVLKSSKDTLKVFSIGFCDIDNELFVQLFTDVKLKLNYLYLINNPAVSDLIVKQYKDYFGVDCKIMK